MKIEIKHVGKLKINFAFLLPPKMQLTFSFVNPIDDSN